MLFVLNEGVDADVAGVLNGLPGELAVYHDQAVDGNPRKDEQGKEQHAARGLLGRMAVELEYQRAYNQAKHEGKAEEQPAVGKDIGKYVVELNAHEREGHQHHRHANRNDLHDGRRIVERHIEAGYTAGFEEGFKQLAHVAHPALQVAQRPALTLAEGHAEVGGLFVVGHRFFYVFDLDAVKSADTGVFHVLSHGVRIKAGDGQRFFGYHEAGAVDGGRKPHAGTGTVEEEVLQIVEHRVAGADPVVGQILAVALALGHLGAAVHGVIHVAQIIGMHNVIGIKDDESINIFTLGVFFEYEFEHIAFGLNGVRALDDLAAVAAGDVFGVIGAVVHRRVDGEVIPIVILIIQRIDQVPDNLRLITGGNNNSKVVFLFGVRRSSFLRSGDKGPQASESKVQTVDQGSDQKNVIQNDHDCSPFRLAFLPNDIIPLN